MRKLFDTRRPLGRLCYLLAALLLALSATHLEAQGPQTTQITDVVYRPDGTPASGTVLISCIVWIVNHWLTPPNAPGK
jgi:hypothetical protein